MHSVPRKLTLGLIIAMGVAACGDDVTVDQVDPPAPVVRSVVVSPASATIAQGGSFEFGAAVDADAGLSNGVTWSVSGGTGITINGSNTGASVIVAATSSATGTASVCATSTANTAVRGCAQLAVTPASPPATVQIDAITVGCTQINLANPTFTGCNLNVPVSVNNTFGQIDVRGTVNRQGSSDVKAVRIEIFAVDAAGNPVGAAEYTNKETLLIDEAIDPSLALQVSNSGAITFSVQTADYNLLPTPTAPTGARVVHPNGQKKIRLTLLGLNDVPLTTSSTSERSLTFRNANGFHVITTTQLNSGNNLNSTCTSSGTAACPVRVNALAGPTAGLAYNGGTSLALTSIPVVYATGALHPNGFTGTIVQSPGTGVGFGNAGCDNLGAGSGGGPRLLGNTAVTALATTNGSTSGTMAYSNVNPTPASPAPAGSVTGYEMSPVCAAGLAGNALVGEVPFGFGVDASGNPVVNIALGGVYGARATLNTPFGPISGTHPTAPAIRLDNGGPQSILGYATGNNDAGSAGVGAADACYGLWLNATQTVAATTTHGAFGCALPAALAVVGISANATPQAAFVFGRTARLNGWINSPVAFNLLSATQVIAAALANVPAGSQGTEGAVAPSANPTGLPLDFGIGNGAFTAFGNASTLLARVGTFGAGGTCNTVAACSALPGSAIRTTGALPSLLTETNTGFALGAIVQSVDPFGNLTNPPASGFPTIGAINNFGTSVCPGAITTLVGSTPLCLNNPLDPVNPYVVAGVLTIGFDNTTPTIAPRGGPATILPALSGQSIAGTTFTNNTIQGGSNVAIGDGGSSADFDYRADDAVPTGLFGASGILTVAPGSDLYVSLSRRDGSPTIQYFCPQANNYQPAGNSCPTQIGWGTNAASGITTATIYVRGAGQILTDPAASIVRAYYRADVFTRDQAGNQTALGVVGACASATTCTIAAGARDFIFDNTPPASFGASFTPGIIPATGSVTFSGSAVEDLDVGRGAFSISYPSLLPMFATIVPPVTTAYFRLPWANKATGLTNPVGYLAAGPSTLSLSLSQTWTTPMRTLEVVTAGDNVIGPGVPGMCGPLAIPPAPANGNGGFTCSAAAGAIGFPGGLNGTGVPLVFTQDPALQAGVAGSVAGGAAPSAFNWFAQSVSRVGLNQAVAAPPTIPIGVGTALSFGQSGNAGTAPPCGVLPIGAPGVAAWYSAIQAAGALCGGVVNQLFNMQWALVNPAAGALDVNAAAGTKSYTAIAFGANGPMQVPFQQVKFYGVDIRQPLNIDGDLVTTPPAGTGAAIVELCTGTSILNDQATNTWQWTCTFTPSGGTANGSLTSILVTNDLAGFNFANVNSLQVSYAAGVFVAGAANGGHWGAAMNDGTAPFNRGWQGNQTQAALAVASTQFPVFAVGCNGRGNCLATRVSTNAGFNITQ